LPQQPTNAPSARPKPFPSKSTPSGQPCQFQQQHSSLLFYYVLFLYAARRLRIVCHIRSQRHDAHPSGKTVAEPKRPASETRNLATQPPDLRSQRCGAMNSNHAIRLLLTASGYTRKVERPARTLASRLRALSEDANCQKVDGSNPGIKFGCVLGLVA
jgi:hypothetical protein